MIQIKNLSNAALSYVINSYLNTDCWFDEHVEAWRDKLEAGYLPGIVTDRGEDTPCIDEKDNSLFIMYVQENFDGETFCFNDVSLFGVFCSTFIGCGLSSVTVNVMAYPDEEDTVIEAVKEDGSHFQRFDFQVTGAEEYNALHDFVEVLDAMYKDWGNPAYWHIEVIAVEVDDENWFVKA